MKLKPCILVTMIITGNVWSSNAQAGDIEKYIASVRSTNGLTFGVIIRDSTGRTNTTEAAVDLICRAPTNTHSVFYLPKEEYLVRLALSNSSNRAISKTELGSKYGKSFDDLHWDIKKYASRPRGSVTVGDAWSWAGHLPKVSDLFAIDKPGEYRLVLEVQIMVLYLNTKEKQLRQVVRFSPVELVVTEPESAQTSRKGN